jgi:hypothetical protein
MNYVSYSDSLQGNINNSFGGFALPQDFQFVNTGCFIKHAGEKNKLGHSPIRTGAKSVGRLSSYEVTKLENPFCLIMSKPVKFLEKVYWTQNLCSFYFFQQSLFEIKHLANYIQDTSRKTDLC